MPIVVRVVTDEEFADWLAKTKATAARDNADTLAKATAARDNADTLASARN
jgi:heme/copper-type cytochrome/quinol oxidase subunit 2